MRIDAWQLKSDNMEKYPQRSWGADGTCELCGRFTDDPVMIEITINGEIVTKKTAHLVPDRESQGEFPVGRICAKKVRRL